MSSSPLNPAVRKNLEKVIADEQRRSAVTLGKVRLVTAIVALVMVLLSMVAMESERAQAFRPTVIGAGLFAVISLLVFALTRWGGRLARWGTLATPLIDVPVISYIQHLQAARLELAWHGIPNAIAVQCGLVALSTLSHSKRVIWLTAFLASASIARRLLSLGIPWPPLTLTLLMPIAIAATGTTLVSRVGSLVHAARRRDLVGKYVLGERLGAGGMAEVFEATYSPEGGFERKVAVKRILPSAASNAEAIALFRREAELGAGLAHPNVVQVLDFGVDGDTWFMALEFVDGLPLSRLLSHARSVRKPPPVEACVYVIEQVAQALEYIHARTSPSGTPLVLVHRDVNPPNVLVSRIGEVKLNDFGVARAADKEQITRAGIMRGKLAYAAPEQLKGEAIDGQADLWALGVTAFELLTLERPFNAADEFGLAKAVLEEPVPSICALRPDVPPALETAVLSLLRRDRQTRASGARQLLGLLGTVDCDRLAGKAALVRWLAEAKEVAGSNSSAFLPTPSDHANTETVTRTTTAKASER